MIIDALKDIFHLFFPNVCPVCGNRITEGGALLCTQCLLDIPLTGYWNDVDNPVAKRFWGHLPIVNACAFMRYSQASRFSKLIYDFKYRGNWRSARRLGVWFGAYLRESGLYNDVDVVVGVPLHMRKKLVRGYNQSQYLAEGIAESLGCRIDTGSVVRRVHNSSQTRKGTIERWENVKDIFDVRSSHDLHGKHILLVDDVLTTGATIISCGESIVKCVPNCRLSIVTLSAVLSGQDV